MFKKSKLKLIVGASTAGILAVGAIVAFIGYGFWKNGQVAEEKAQDELAKERMAGEGSINSNGPAVTSKA